MAIFENFPYTNFHELNLDWVIKIVKDCVEETGKTKISIEELKAYVENYFENLDVQDEINNKLQQMYEDGDLEVIIEQFLQTSSLLVFNTTTDMVAAENLVEDVTVMRLGNLTYDDGDTDIFKIRTITSSDIVDGINIIALTNYPTLIAEKIKNDVGDYVAFEYGDISFKRYDYSTYMIDVIKLARTNQDGSVNVPKVNGSTQATSFYDLSKGSMIACNGSFFNQDNGHLVGDILADGELVDGDPISSSMSFTCYMGIDNEGKFKYYDRSTDLSTLPDTVRNVIMAWCPLVEGGVVSSRIKNDNETTQQQIGYDTDMNYYIITTTYKCPLTYRDMADWILTNIPYADTFYAMDSGGSTQTSIADVRTNLETDLTVKNGRQVTGCVYFEKRQSGNLDVLSNVIRINQENSNIRTIYHTQSPVQIAPGVSLIYTTLYQKGNMVFGNITFNVTSDATQGSWIDISNSLPFPNPDETVFFTTVAAESTFRISRMNITKNTTQIQTGTTVEVRFIGTGTFDYNICYATKQNA